MRTLGRMEEHGIARKVLGISASASLYLGNQIFSAG
jgi:hypothetical protein